MAKVTNANIDTLIDIVQDELEFARMSDDSAVKFRHEHRAHVLRKIYIMFLHATSRGQLDLLTLSRDGISDADPVNTAIEALCPTADNKN